jgi:DnaK suppressor protein
MKPLSPSDLVSLAEQLEAMRRKALDELREVDVPASLAPEVHDRADEAETERVDDMRMAEAAIDRATVRDIALAEHRMSTGDYGVCIDCGEGIPRARLFAQPTAVRCAACQAAFETHSPH